MSNDEKLNWLTYWVGITFCMVCLALAMQGCGNDEATEPGDECVVDIICNERSCTVLIHNCEDVEARYNGRLEWWDNVSPLRRATYVDAPPPGEFSVTACNDYGCTTGTVER